MELLDHLPHNWPEALAFIAFIVYTLWRDRRADKKTTEVHKQTVNGHHPEKTNLRDDVDKSIRVGESAAASGAVTVRMLEDFRAETRDGLNEFRTEARDALKDIRKDIGGIRQELRDERQERIEGDRRRGSG